MKDEQKIIGIKLHWKSGGFWCGLVVHQDIVEFPLLVINYHECTNDYALGLALIGISLRFQINKNI